ncbi:unnamed protein product [Eruca vesicaria subsp. sativa]|uniref:F-box domain-containing protein n=1 Tax=Eruca vesicaria subsp. sativa TaxID=29727 RepID=A0ABC8LTE0_ERUVS|nr:unnamed protein product [Eruca vesicaria subsp. sativa]
MDESENKPSHPPVISTWSDLCPDLLRSVFELLSFTNLVRAKSVCKSWNSAWRSCTPKRNQIPWLILFPQENQTNSNNNSCALFVPDDKDNIYKTRDLGANFTRSRCVASYGSWLLMRDHVRNLYIINPLTLERIDLPQYYSLSKHLIRQPRLACLWVDNITRNYLVLWVLYDHMVYTRKGDGRWRTASTDRVGEPKQIVYNCKDHKVYFTTELSWIVFVWDFSDDIPKENQNLLPFDVAIYDLFDEGTVELSKYFYFRRMIATRVSGQVLVVTCMVQDSIWQFRIFEYDPLTTSWEKADDLGDEALILDMGFTVVAKDIIPAGLKRNSIYFSGSDHYKKDPDHIFVYDLGTRTTEHLPQSVVSSVGFSHARWFFPDITC